MIIYRETQEQQVKKTNGKKDSRREKKRDREEKQQWLCSEVINDQPHPCNRQSRGRHRMCRNSVLSDSVVLSLCCSTCAVPSVCVQFLIDDIALLFSVRSINIY